MFLPYRAKNPPERVPYATYSLIGLNTLIYALTSHDLLYIREGAMHALAVSDETLSPWRLLTAMFLHANPLHLIGNMLFLWIFGASLEGRLGPPKFLALYLCAGLTGSLLDEFVVGIHHPGRFSLGASGAIMGLAGAYLWVFPHAIISVFRVWIPFVFGSYDWKAQWVILYYVALDVLNGVLGAGDGVAHFAHIGGAATGLLLVVAMRVPRDDEQYSNAQANLASFKNPAELNIYELEALMGSAKPSVSLIQAYCQKRALSGHPADHAKCAAALQTHARTLMEQGDAADLGTLVLQLPAETTASLPTVFFLRLGSQLERIYANDLATKVYYRVLEINSMAPDAECALFRLGRLADKAYGDPEQARHFYSEMLRCFPNGSLTLDGQRALAALSAPAAAAVPRPS